MADLAPRRFLPALIACCLLGGAAAIAGSAWSYFGEGGMENNCADASDNDADGQTDCADAECFGASGTCDTEMANGGSCADGHDNDADGQTDCADSDCTVSPSCAELACFDLDDNDADGQTDCADSDCASASTSCSYSSETSGTYSYCGGGIAMGDSCGNGAVNCSNAADDDGDGQTDCADSDCAAYCLPPNETSCTNTVDDDGDGNTDCSDSDCTPHHACGGTETSSGGTCSDGIDADADGRTDGADSNCSEGDGGYGCGDGLDNDQDGAADGLDSGCPEGAGGLGCADGLDNDSDGYLDGLDSGCPEGAGGLGCTDDSDNDSDGFTDCADSGCSGVTVDSYGIEDGSCVVACLSGSPQTSCIESNPSGCFDGGDNDADGDYDGADADCPEGANGYGCADSLDNDVDGDYDGADSGCPEGANGYGCADGEDSDGDGNTDGEDSGCQEGDGGLGCADGLDNDGDTYVDGFEVACGEGAGGLACADGLDNDGDGDADCADPGCAAAVACDVTAPTLLAFFSTSTNGTYVAGQTVTVFARFSEAVAISSTMTVSLDSGGTVSLAATSSESTLLRGVYAVGAGQSSADLAASSIDAASVADLNANAYSPAGLPGTNISDGSAIAVSAAESAACADSLDNDADGDVDCEDSQCDGVGSCEHGAEESCADSVDNDGDGLSDCADADCAGYFACGATETAGECGNAADDDGDGQTDCADADCAYLASCGGAESSCADSADNDGDGQTDCADAECASGDVCDASPRRSSGRRARQPERATASSLPAAVDLNGNGVIEPTLGEVVTSQNVEALFGFEGGKDAVANPTLAASLGCDPYLTATLGRGRLNPPAQVSKLQTILNALVSITLPVTGLFDEATESAVKAFQLEHEDAILRPWGAELCPGGVCQPTGVVGLTTRRFINRLVCGF